ncbi:MAG: hypothetical protein HUJ65_03975, partial [Oscillospiraceae bacterium]|nr:hypothetical protein [Oscillospiraceae bacterium]
MQLLYLAIRLALLVLTGIGARKLKIVDGTFQKQLSNFIMNIGLPCLIVNSFSIEFSMDELMNCLKLAGVALAVLVLLFILGEIC